MARTFTFKKLDAFAAGASSGNPAGVVYLSPEETLCEAEMLQIAQELKGFVSEVGYVRLPKSGRLELRYFSSEREVEFCGHATIAICADILQTRPEWADLEQLTLQINSGELRAYNRMKDEGAVYISAPPPRPNPRVPEPGALAQALGIATAQLNPNAPLAILNGGLETIIVPLDGLETCLGLKPDLETLNIYCQSQGADILICYSNQTVDPASHYRTRVFAPTFGYLEDPATGSGNAALGYHLLNLGVWDGSPLLIEQSGEREAFNRVKLGTQGEGPERRILIGGGAICRIEGIYRLA
ncbi:MAG: PhzF family phenazine biosynthesis protein [bacterium]|nr:PhzF family phenazine biosynthesis protein [bacterium]